MSARPTPELEADTSLTRCCCLRRFTVIRGFSPNIYVGTGLMSASQGQPDDLRCGACGQEVG